MNKLESTHSHYLSQIKAILDRVFSAQYGRAGLDCENYLFGSRATDQYHDVSDYDIGVLASRDISRELGTARELLETSDIPFTVDLVDLGAASEEFARQVQQEGVLLEKLERDEQLTGKYSGPDLTGVTGNTYAY